MSKLLFIVLNIGLFCMLSVAMGYFIAVALTGA
jgi:nitrate reductase NapE component